MGLPTLSVQLGGLGGSMGSTISVQEPQPVPTQGVQQQGGVSQAAQMQFEQAYEHFKRTGCVPVPQTYVPAAPVQRYPAAQNELVPEGYGLELPRIAQEGLRMPEARMPEAPMPYPVPAPFTDNIVPPSHLFNLQHPQTPPRTAMFPTIDQLHPPSSSSLPSTNRLSQSQHGGTGPPSCGGSSPVPMAASARAAQTCATNDWTIVD
eukprot:5095073-Amphidinium_carterae.1